MELVAAFRRIPPLQWSALAILVLGLLGFWFTETMMVARVLLLSLALAAVILGLTNRDRVLWSLVAVYTGILSLLYLALNQLLPPWVSFPTAGLAAAILLMFFAESTKGEEQWVAAAGGLFIVQLLWMLLAWPFDPQSKAVVLVLFFYGIGMMLRWQRGGGTFRLRDFLGGWLWLLLILIVVLSLAEWYA